MLHDDLAGSFLSPSFNLISFRDRDSVDLCLSDLMPRRFRKLGKLRGNGGKGGVEGCSFSVIATEKEIMKMIIISSGGVGVGVEKQQQLQH